MVLQQLNYITINLIVSLMTSFFMMGQYKQKEQPLAAQTVFLSQN